MMHRLFIVLIWTLSVSQIAYLQAQQRNAQGAPAASKDKDKDKDEVQQPSVLAVPKNYRYNAQGRRDPFVNPVPKPPTPTAAKAAPVCTAPGLKGVPVTQMSIAGVVTSKEAPMNVVVIKTRAGKTYFAHLGDMLCDAVVKEIRMDSITFATITAGTETDQKPREIVLKLNPTPGGNK
jgi:hypothetical protein